MSTPAKHTPGPWRVDQRETTFEVIGQDGIFVLSTSWHSSLRKPYPLKAEAFANANLAAAAPDLLAALIEAEAFIKRTSGGGETDFRTKLNAAIRLATPVLEREGK